MGYKTLDARKINYGASDCYSYGSGGGGETPITLGAHTFLLNTNPALTPQSATTDPIVTTGATLLVVGIVDFSNAGSHGTVSDSKNNSWSALTAQRESSENFTAHIFYSANPTVGTNHTFTYTIPVTAVYQIIFAAAFNSVKTPSPFDVQNGAAAPPTPTLQPGSITPSESNELIISVGCSDSNVDAPTVDASMTMIDSAAGVSGLSVGGGIAYAVQTTAAAINPTWTDDNMRAVVIASFKAQ